MLYLTKAVNLLPTSKENSIPMLSETPMFLALPDPQLKMFGSDLKDRNLNIAGTSR